MTRLAMFPLGHVLVPGETLPLQVFEPRYRQLISDLLADDGPPEFGVVLIERGSEVGGGDVRSEVGTVARIADLMVTPDGRYVLVAVGTRRIRVADWLPDDPYPQADVTDWPDDPGGDWAAAPDLVGSLRMTADRVVELRRRLGAPAVALDESTVPDPVLHSYRLVAAAPIGPADRYRALCAPGPTERLQVLDVALSDAEAVLAFGGTDPP